MARGTRTNEQGFEDLSSYSSAKEYKKRRKNHRGRLAFRICAAVFCVLLVAAGAVMIYIATDLLEGLTTTSITKDPEALGIDVGNQNIVMDESVKNIALFGVDSRRDTFTGQSDVIMVLTVDNKHKKLKMTSILRDSKVPIEGGTLDGDYLLNWDTKINAAYAYGGPELAIRTLNRNFGLDITDYVTVNFADMAAIVDAFGGVDLVLTAEEVRQINVNLWNLLVDVERKKEEDQADGTFGQYNYASITREDIIPDASGRLNIDSGNYVGGEYHLNGDQAVAFGRIRYIDSDFGRVDRQHKVLRALIGKLQTMGYSEYPALIKQMMPYCETSLELNDVVALTPILTNDFTVESIKVPNIEYETDLFDGRLDDGISYLVYDVTQAAKRISSFIYEETSPYWEEYGNTAEDSASGGAQQNG